MKKQNTEMFKEWSPNHLIEEILLMLPPKSLLRFKCLSKSWNDTISSPVFRRAHLQKSKTKPPLIVAGNTETLSKFGLDKEAGHNVHNLEEHLNIQSQLTGLQNDLVIENACDGILCIRTAAEAEHIIEAICSQNMIELVLWNPSIRKHKILTVPKTEHAKERFGIGYDPSTDDYKIIKVMMKEDKSKDSSYSEFELCTVKSNIWKPLSYDLSYIINIWSSPLSLKGLMYWLADLEERRAIVCVDLANETFRAVELPPIGCGWIGGLVELDGKLGCYCAGHGLIDVWVMEGDESWVRLIISPYSYLNDPIRLHLHLLPDTLKTSAMELKFLSSVNMFQPFIFCAPSLISFDF